MKTYKNEYPTVEGFYWLRGTLSDDGGFVDEPVLVNERDFELIGQDCAYKAGTSLEGDYWFCGPLERPVELEGEG
jgi:hypothetical protein